MSNLIKITEENAKEVFQEMWQWLADNPLEGKKDWPKMVQFKHFLHFCTACEVASQRKKRKNDTNQICNFCPITEWRKNAYAPCLRIGTPYFEWSESIGKYESKIGLCDYANEESDIYYWDNNPDELEELKNKCAKAAQAIRDMEWES